jgi:hypothetical protein
MSGKLRSRILYRNSQHHKPGSSPGGNGASHLNMGWHILWAARTRMLGWTSSGVVDQPTFPEAATDGACETFS